MDTVAKRFQEISAIFQAAAESDYPAMVERVAMCIGDALAAGRKLLVFGNGGSASDAQHLCGELVVRFQSNRRALAAIALVSDAAVLTACGNDFSFERIFSRQIEALGSEGDIALGISTSGQSSNVVLAFHAALERGMTVILLSGPIQSEASRLAHLVLAAPGPNTARVQEIHLASYHAICEALDKRFAVSCE